MAMARVILGAVVIVTLGASAAPAGEKEQPIPATIVYRDDSRVELKSITVAVKSEGIFGVSVEPLEKLPVKADRLLLQVPLQNLVKIEILAADKSGKNVRVKLTDTDGKTCEGVITHEKNLVWKGAHAFAGSEATLDLTEVKEILLRPRRSGKE